MRSSGRRSTVALCGAGRLALAADVPVTPVAIPAVKVTRQSMGRVKGTMLVPLIKALRGDKQASLPHLPVELHPLLSDQRVLPSSWYPASAHLHLVRAVVATLPLGKDPLQHMGKAGVEHDLKGVFQAQLRAGDPARTLSALTAIWRTCFDAGELVPTIESATSARIALRGHQDPSAEVCGIIGGYIMGSVSLAGGKLAVLNKPQCVNRGDAECQWRISWR